MAAKKCVICGESAAGTEVVHESCHEHALADVACVDCERDPEDVAFDTERHELAMLYLPNYRRVAELGGIPR